MLKLIHASVRQNHVLPALTPCRSASGIPVTAGLEQVLVFSSAVGELQNCANALFFELLLRIIVMLNYNKL